MTTIGEKRFSKSLLASISGRQKFNGASSFLRESSTQKKNTYYKAFEIKPVASKKRILNISSFNTVQVGKILNPTQKFFTQKINQLKTDEKKLNKQISRINGDLPIVPRTSLISKLQSSEKQMHIFNFTLDIKPPLVYYKSNVSLDKSFILVIDDFFEEFSRSYNNFIKRNGLDSVALWKLKRLLISPTFPFKEYVDLLFSVSENELKESLPKPYLKSLFKSNYLFHVKQSDSATKSSILNPPNIITGLQRKKRMNKGGVGVKDTQENIENDSLLFHMLFYFFKKLNKETFKGTKNTIKHCHEDSIKILKKMEAFQNADKKYQDRVKLKKGEYSEFEKVKKILDPPKFGMDHKLHKLLDYSNILNSNSSLNYKKFFKTDRY